MVQVNWETKKKHDEKKKKGDLELDGSRLIQIIPDFYQNPPISSQNGVE